MKAVQTVFVDRRKLELVVLYELPFTQFGMNAVERLITEEEIKDIIKLTKKLTAK